MRNNNYPLKNTFVISLSLIIAMILTIVPLPGNMGWCRPLWVFLVLFCWLKMAPHIVGVITAMLIGFLVDLLTGSVLGMHAFIFTLLAFMTIKFRVYAYNLPIWQQSIFLFLLILFYLILQFWMIELQGGGIDAWQYWMTLFTSIVVWPVVNYVLKNVQMRYKVV
jgi:rod shape-determining protein MreD